MNHPAELHGILHQSIHDSFEDTGDIARVRSAHKVDVDALNGPSLAVSITLRRKPIPDVSSGLRVVVLS